jgi:hypothetical protein
VNQTAESHRHLYSVHPNPEKGKAATQFQETPPYAYHDMNLVFRGAQVSSRKGSESLNKYISAAGMSTNRTQTQNAIY